MSEVISARLPQDYQLRLEALLDGQSLGAWLRQVIDDSEKVQSLAAEADGLARVIARRRQELEAVEGALEGQRALAQEPQGLHQAGLTAGKLGSWSRVLAGAGVKVSDLAGQLEHYGSLAAACRELQKEETRLAQAVKVLGRKQAELEGGIGAVRGSAVEAMSEVRKKAVAEVEALMKGLREKVAAYGEACRLGEVLAATWRLPPIYTAWRSRTSPPRCRRRPCCRF